MERWSQATTSTKKRIWCRLRLLRIVVAHSKAKLLSSGPGIYHWKTCHSWRVTAIIMQTKTIFLCLFCLSCTLLHLSCLRTQGYAGNEEEGGGAGLARLETLGQSIRNLGKYELQDKIHPRTTRQSEHKTWSRFNRRRRTIIQVQSISPSAYN